MPSFPEGSMGHPTTFRKVWIQPRTGLRHSSPLSFSIGLSIPWMVSSRKTVAHTLLSWPLCVGQAQRGTVTCPRSQSKAQAFSIDLPKPLCGPRMGIRMEEGKLCACRSLLQAYRGTDGQRLVQAGGAALGAVPPAG